MGVVFDVLVWLVMCETCHHKGEVILSRNYLLNAFSSFSCLHRTPIFCVQGLPKKKCWYLLQEIWDDHLSLERNVLWMTGCINDPLYACAFSQHICAVLNILKIRVFLWKISQLQGVLNLTVTFHSNKEMIKGRLCSKPPKRAKLRERFKTAKILTKTKALFANFNWYRPIN